MCIQSREPGVKVNRNSVVCLLNYKPAVGIAAIKDLQRNLLQQFRLLEADTSRIRKPCLWSFLHGFWLMTFNPWDNIKKTKKKNDIWSFGNEHTRRLNLNHRCLASTGLQLLTKPSQTKFFRINMFHFTNKDVKLVWQPCSPARFSRRTSYSI